MNVSTQHMRVEASLNEFIPSVGRSLTRLKNACADQESQETIKKLHSIALLKIRYIQERINPSEEVRIKLNEIAAVLESSGLEFPQELILMKEALMACAPKQESYSSSSKENLEFNDLINQFRALKQAPPNGTAEVPLSFFFKLQERAHKLERHPLLLKKINDLVNNHLISLLITEIPKTDFTTPSNIILMKENGFFQMIVDMGLSIVLENDELKINDIPAFYHHTTLLFSALNLIKMLQLFQGLESPCLLLGLTAARQEFILASCLEDKVIDRWEAARLASNLAYIILSPEGIEFLKKDTIADSMLNQLVDYTKKGSLSPFDIKSPDIFVNQLPKTEEEGQFQQFFLNNLTNIQASLEQLAED